MHSDLLTFLEYLDRVHARTRNVVACIPADGLEWAPAPGRWTAGDQVRHLAAIERWMYADTVSGRPGRRSRRGSGSAQCWSTRRIIAVSSTSRWGCLGVATPPIYGLTEPELRAQSVQRIVAADEGAQPLQNAIRQTGPSHS